MKKSLLILTLFLTLVVTSVTLAQCTLNPRQWRHISNSSDFQLYLDTSFLQMDGQILNAGGCFYYPRGCGTKHRGSKGEHYHMSHVGINSGFFSYAIKSVVYADMYGNQIGDGTYFDDDEIIYEPIPRGSMIEAFCVTALRMAGKL